MKNKIIALIISATLLLASLTVGVFAAGETLKSGVFSLNGASEGTYFAMSRVELPSESVEFIETMFDKFAYDANLYGAYKASLTKDGDAVSFTDDMSVTITLASSYDESEIFLFNINEGNGASSARIDGTREGNKLTISGKDFASLSDGIIVVMTASTAPEYTIVPAVICAGIALVSIIVSVVVVRKKDSKESITD
jgi:hypothetical protein